MENMVDVGPRWLLPRKGFVKLNVHGFFSDEPLPNGNRSGIGIVIRDDRGDIKRMLAGTLGINDRRNNEFYAMMYGLRKAFYEKYDKVELDMDHVDAAWEWRNSREDGVVPEHSYIVQQLNQRKADKNLKLYVMPVDEADNQLARYLAQHGAATWDRMVVITAPFGRVSEIWSEDMGLGPVEQRFMEVREEDLNDPIIIEEEAEFVLQEEN